MRVQARYTVRSYVLLKECVSNETCVYILHVTCRHVLPSPPPAPRTTPRPTPTRRRRHDPHVLAPCTMSMGSMVVACWLIFPIIHVDFARILAHEHWGTDTHTFFSCRGARHGARVSHPTGAAALRPVMPCRPCISNFSRTRRSPPPALPVSPTHHKAPSAAPPPPLTRSHSRCASGSSPTSH